MKKCAVTLVDKLVIIQEKTNNFVKRYDHCPCHSNCQKRKALPSPFSIIQNLSPNLPVILHYLRKNIGSVSYKVSCFTLV